MTNEEAVAQGAQLFADVEAALIALSAGLPGVINAVRDNVPDGATTPLIGGAEALQRVADGLTLTNSALSDIVGLHSDLTARCQELGIDVPPPAAAKGGAHPLGGTR